MHIKYNDSSLFYTQNSRFLSTITWDFPGWNMSMLYNNGYIISYKTPIQSIITAVFWCAIIIQVLGSGEIGV